MLKFMEIMSSLPDWFRWILYPLHFAGGSNGYLMLLPVVYWCISRKKGEELIILLFSAALIGAALKLAVQELRPYIQYPEIVSNFVEEPSFSFPSSHSIYFAVIGTWLFISFKKNWVRITAAALVFIGGLSRVIYGVHFPRDVFAGWLIGIMTVTGFFWLKEKGITDKIKNPPVFITIVNSILICGLFTYTMLVSADFEQRKTVLSFLGTFNGLLWGYAPVWKSMGFTALGNLKQTVLKLLAGLGLLVPLYVVSGAVFHLIFSEPVPIFGCVIYLLRYMIIGFSAAYLLPLLFVKMKILKTENSD